MLPLGEYRSLRKCLRKLTKEKPEPCKQRRLLMRLIADGEGPNVVRLRPTMAEASRLALIDAGKRYCLAKCGGCPLTEGYVPPV